MLVKGIVLKDNTVYKNLDVKETIDFESFIETKFLEDNADFKKGDVVLFNKRILYRIYP